MKENYWGERAALILEARAHQGSWNDCHKCVAGVVLFCTRNSNTQSELYEMVSDFIIAIDGLEALSGLNRPLYRIVEDY